MKEFEPSKNFVGNVMRSVRACAAEGAKERLTADRLLSSRAVRFALSAGAAAIGVVNLARISFTILSPALCR